MTKLINYLWGLSGRSSRFNNWRGLIKHHFPKRLKFLARLPLVDHWGVTLFYTTMRGEVLWLWPWKRKNNKKYLNIDCGGTFNSLEEIDAFWESWIDAVKRQGDLEAKT